MAISKFGFGDCVGMSVTRKQTCSTDIKIHGQATIECVGPDGKVKWTDTNHNDVTNVGLQYILDVVFEGATNPDTWYVGLIQSSPTPATTDTMVSHPLWDEFEAYSETPRQIFNDTRSGQQISNDNNKASFSINGTGGGVGGAFICTDDTKGGTSGTLMCVEAASEGDRSVQSGDTINVSYTITASDA